MPRPPAAPLIGGGQGELEAVVSRILRRDSLAEATETHAPTLYRLLRALASVGVFAEQSDGRFGLTPLAEHLRTDASGSLRAWAMHIGRPYTWSTWAYLLHSVRTGEPAHPEEGAIFDAAMTGLSVAKVEAVVRSYDFSGSVS